MSKGRPECVSYMKGTMPLDHDGFEYVEVMVWHNASYTYTFCKESSEKLSRVVLTKTVAKLFTEMSLIGGTCVSKVYICGHLVKSHEEVLEKLKEYM